MLITKSPVTDNSLVASYLEGHESSLETLIHRHKRAVFSYIKKYVKDAELADDFR